MKLLATKELGKLCKWLRILGLDTRSAESESHSNIIFAALKESRIILTRDTKLGAHRGIRVVLIKSDFLKEQLTQLFNELKLEINTENIFRRCTICNEPLQDADKDKIKDLIPEYVFRTQSQFVQCLRCGRIYWEGTHWGNVTSTLKKIGLL